MSDETSGSASAPLSLPDAANLEWLRKQAKQRLREIRKRKAEARLSDAQLDVARQYGFTSWRALKARVDALTIEGQLVEAARVGNAERLGALLDAHPDELHLRAKPYGTTLLHLAARSAPAVRLLLDRGLDPNAREAGDNTYAMHWAAAAGAVESVRLLADAGGDVVGHGDDHALEIIGWATCWDGTDDEPHRRVVDLLLSRGATHNIFSAMSMGLEQEVRRIAADHPEALEQRLSHNEDFQRPLHFAVRRRLPAMVSLLIELGADPSGTDASGHTAAAYAGTPDIDRPVMQALRRQGRMDLTVALAVGDWAAASRLLDENPAAIDGGALHVMAKRGAIAAVQWLLDHGANPNALWDHWDSRLTAAHLAVLQDHVEVVRGLLAAGADPTIRDSKHDSDVVGWAEFFGRVEIVRLLRAP